MQQRRRFIKYSIVLLAGVGLAASGWWRWGRQAGPVLLSSTGLGAEADAVLADIQDANPIAEWAMAEYEALRQPLPALVDALRQRLQLSAKEQPSGDRFSAALKQAIRDDFDAQRVIDVKGWQLSHSEVLAATVRWHLVGAAADQLEQPVAREVKIATITNWGPRQTRVGEPANEQSGGYSALWFDSENIPRWAEIAIAGVRLDTYHRGRVVTVDIKGPLQNKLLSQPGEHAITLHDDMANTWQQIGIFKVLPKLADVEKVTGDLCQVTRWGPQQTTLGEVPNAQPDGSMGLWIDTPCAPHGVKVRFGDTLVKAYFNGHAVTALIPAHLLQVAGDIPLSLIDENGQDEMAFGRFSIGSK